MCRLGIVVDFLSHSTITGFMGGTATIICLQQLKGMFGLKHFTTKTDVVSVLHSIISHRHEVVAQNSHSSIIIVIVVVHPRLFPFFHFFDSQGCPRTSTNSHSWSGQRRVIHSEGRKSTRNYTFCGLTPITEFLLIM